MIFDFMFWVLLYSSTTWITHHHTIERKKGDDITLAHIRTHTQTLSPPF